jgi:6-pyruvoyltetrahydropterin/6-carboxytetrahydropterin synthase
VPYTIEKDFAFSASHVLVGLPEGHQCGRLHGHNYVVRVRLSGDRLLDVGFLFDYGDLKPLGKFIDDALDHRHLNDVMDLNPTAENLARHLGKMTKGLLPNLPRSLVVSVGVSETPKTWAWWTP